MKEMSFIDAVNNIGEYQFPPNRFENSAGYICDLLPPMAINRILNNLENSPNSGFAHNVLFILLSGKIAENKHLNTSYNQIDVKLLLQYVSRWNEGDDANSNIEWIRQFRKDMIQYAYNDYINFPDLNIVDYLNAYYGDNKDSLICIKNKYNPSYIFEFS
ncbi:MAG: BBE domain-containing protein [Romboutsia sp.]|uniref:BBE domain-containing protein n=1 Tax=Romboutsia sp. TaxID=1965302 RepID=UPI003F35F55B